MLNSIFVPLFANFFLTFPGSVMHWTNFSYPCPRISFSLLPTTLCIEQCFQTLVCKFLYHFSRQCYSLNNVFVPLSANFFITSHDSVMYGHWFKRILLLQLWWRFFYLKCWNYNRDTLMTVETFLYPCLRISLSLLTAALCMAIDLREFY